MIIIENEQMTYVCVKRHIRGSFVTNNTNKERRRKLTYGAVVSHEVVSALAVVLVHSAADAVTQAAPAIVAVDATTMGAISTSMIPKIH